jgi:hypothetical protein
MRVINALSFLMLSFKAIISGVVCIMMLFNRVQKNAY